MAKFLFTVWPYPGHIHPNVAIAHALGTRGHETAFYTGGSVTPALEREGFQCFPFHSVNERRVEQIVLTLDAQSLQPWKGLGARKLLREWLLGTVDAQLADLKPILSSWAPDVIVCDPAMWGPLLVLHETERVPLAIMSYVAACMLPGPEGPILGLPLPKARGRLARFGRRVLRSIADAVAADIRREAEQLRRSHGLRALRTSVTEFAGQMPLYLVPSTPAYDRSRNDLPRSVKYVGPCHWDKPQLAAAPLWLAELPDDRPIVYVTEGTMHSKPPLLLRATLTGLASTRVQVIATTGRHRAPESLALGDISANARVEQWVPHSDLLPRTDVVVTTGGTGTVLAALSAGVPLIIVPMAWDQPENAWRVVEAGAGIRLAPKRCTPNAIRDAVDRVLSDPSFKHNARRLGADLALYGGAEHAAGLLADLVSFSDARVSREANETLRGSHAPVLNHPSWSGGSRD